MARSSQGANFTLNRAASHAGSWYTSDGYTLNRQLDEWLKQAGGMNSASVPEQRAIVAPHAGYSYSGPTAAYAYRVIVPSNVKRVFILGPSHHYRLQGCALSRTKEYETPLYNLKLDTSLIEELHSTGNFEWMSQTTDEDEHSIEMHLPYIAKVMEGCSFTIVPVLVGNLNRKAEQFYGHLFSKYLADKENFFVISSDFCHWGKRFSYKHYDKRNGTISQHIENLDKALSRVFTNFRV
ncbi:MEMO1 [Bugula neritina]|uniref:MEMO1 n=1 Tax=Bugula neritina TaxID=10212 RepID=A0A7J7KGL6_BUGNE|nr:MEMO1 [Bugula neritina]